jgi:predicted O-methyltransferase YrrM
VIHIRPHALFSLVPEQSAEARMVSMKIPIRRRPQFADYSLRLLELMVLIGCTRIVGASRIFEVGTFCGNTALHLAANSNATVFTLDADEATLQKAGLAELYKWREDFPLESAHLPNVATLRGDSQTFDFSPWYRSIDLVVIDGDHSREAVSRDTANAMQMIRSDRGMIAWHDYGNPGTLENSAYLDRLSASYPLFHIEDSMLVLFLSNNDLMNRLRRNAGV